MHVDASTQQIRFRHVLGPKAGTQDTLSLKRFGLGDRDFQRASRKIEEILTAQRTEADHLQSTRDWLEAVPRKLRSYLNDRLLAHDPQLVIRTVVRLAEQLDEYEAYRQSRETNPRTDAQVVMDCRRLAYRCPSDVTRIDESILRDLLAEIEDEHQLAANTLARIAKNWHTFFEWLRTPDKRSQRAAVIDSNPCALLDRSTTRREKDEVRTEWIDAMVAACSTTEERYWLRLLQWTGCRLAEGLRLRVCDFDRVKGTIEITETKNDRIRINPIYAALEEYLPELLDDRDRDERVLRSITYNTCYEWLSRMQTLAGVPTWQPPYNAFRSTRANQLAANRKISPQQAGLLLGHSAVVAEANYLSADEATLDTVRECV
jgi:integrase